MNDLIRLLIQFILPGISVVYLVVCLMGSLVNKKFVDVLSIIIYVTSLFIGFWFCIFILLTDPSSHSLNNEKLLESLKSLIPFYIIATLSILGTILRYIYLKNGFDKNSKAKNPKKTLDLLFIALVTEATTWVLGVIHVIAMFLERI